MASTPTPIPVATPTLTPTPSSTPTPSPTDEVSPTATDAALEALTSCVTTVTLRDFAYAKCAMSSGLFGEYIPSDDDYTKGGLKDPDANVDALLQYVDDVDIVGTCQLMCSRPAISASTSCCDAVTRLHACRLSAAAPDDELVTCKQMIDTTFAYTHECDALSGESVALISVLTAVVCALGAIALWSRRAARNAGATTTKRLQPTDTNDSNAGTTSPDLEARVAGATSASYASACLAFYRQVANLVWKNVLLRRRKPVAFAVEQLLPLVLVAALLVLANLDALFPTAASERLDAMTTTEAFERPLYTTPGPDMTRIGATSNFTLVCTALMPVTAASLGAPTAARQSFLTSSQSVLALFFLVAYVKFVSTTTTAIVLEKETRVREVMKIMGLSDAALLTSWCVTTALLALPLSLAVALVLKYGRVFPAEELGVLALLFWALSIAIVAFSVGVAPLFRKARTAAVVSVLLWLVLFFPFFAAQPSTVLATKYWAALAPPTAFALGIDAILRRAQLGTGFALTIGTSQLSTDDVIPTASAMSAMLLLDAALLVAIGWYLEQVLPQQYGVRKPFYFFCTRAYWRGSGGSPTLSASAPVAASHGSDVSVSTPQSSSSGGGAYVAFTDDASPASSSASIEPVSAVLQAQEARGTCLQLRGLRKVFPLDDGDSHVAVHGLDLTMYCGQITALLGPNGAGKTTTLSMLTGLLAPTAGDATLFGRSLQRDVDELRRVIGVCPQHDVLFADLTVDEHLALFGTMKGVSPDALRAAVDALVEDVGLTDARFVLAKDLSGGQKRKLSVALAFIGGSKLVFLDEPTSGMDPYSRRFTWNLLQRQRADRVIVLTTHFMDEADILGDRIAIVADGRLCCVGSSLFLKTRYGAGYNLTLLKSSSSACTPARVAALLTQFVPDAHCLSSAGAEMVFQLPTAASPAFPAMLRALDAHLAELDVLQYGISVTTLEEVFLRIARDRDDVAAVTAAATATRTSVALQVPRPSLLGGGDKVLDGAVGHRTPTFATQYIALTRKRFQIARRDKKTLATAVGIPLLFLTLLASLPTIQVASFIPEYATSFATEETQLNCPAANVSTALLRGQNLTSCLAASGFGYCTLGAIDCDPQVCCNAANYRSPLYPCNTCALTTTALAVGTRPRPCYSATCMKRNDAKLQVTMNAFVVAVVVMLAFAFVPAAVVAFVVREKAPTQDAKSLQLISGANVSAYWFANWTHDVVVAVLPVVVAIVVVPLAARGLSGTDATLAVALLVALHVLASIPLAYLWAFRFREHAVAQTSLLVFALSSGGLLSIFSFLCRVIDFRLSATLTLSALDRNYLRWLFMLFPGYSLNSGVYEIAARHVSRRAVFGSGRSQLGTPSFFGLFEGLGRAPCVECWDRIRSTCCVRGVWDLDVGGAPIVYAAVEAVVFTALVFVIEKRRNNVHWRPRADRSGDRAVPPASDEDDDVAAERMRVERTPPSGTDSVFIRNLHHQYGGARGKVAVKNLSLAIPRGECFGYLGINGAGKSTTMQVLTGSLAPTDGFVMLGPHDLAFDCSSARRLIGYCPQFDALHDLLTVTEQLALYARLKGVPADRVSNAVDDLIEQLGLAASRHKLTRALSGGNKRKVSTAIALLGAPPVVFLDEPSTGVDPSARRKMWDAIAAACTHGDASVVLTTHSMEECEALCTRVGIMVSGALQCLGSVEHLKQKFGHGFTVEVKLCEPPAADVEQVQSEVMRQLLATPGADSDVNVRITSDNVAELCIALGDAARGDRILCGDGNGWVVQNFFATTGSIPLDVFSAWWVAEAASEALQTFFAAACPGSALVEQQGDHLRFQVPKHALRPAAIFALLEDAKTRLRVGEYGVSDTSLEHIFNNMAAQQEEERGVVRGMYQQQQQQHE